MSEYIKRYMNISTTVLYFTERSYLREIRLA